MEPERAADIRSMWGPENGDRPTPNPVNDALFAGIGLEVAADFPVSPESVWDLVSDPTRIGEFSPECQGARWIEGSDRAATGARFEGTNRTTLDDGRIFEWIRPCTITRCERPSLYEYVAHDRWNQPATRWSFRIEPTPDGCRAVHSMQILADGLSGLRLAADADPSTARTLLDQRLPDLLRGIQDTLQQMHAHLMRESV